MVTPRMLFAPKHAPDLIHAGELWPLRPVPADFKPRPAQRNHVTRHAGAVVVGASRTQTLASTLPLPGKYVGMAADWPSSLTRLSAAAKAAPESPFWRSETG
jgi:hypothetical protein